MGERDRQTDRQRKRQRQTDIQASRHPATQTDRNKHYRDHYVCTKDAGT